MVSLGRPDGERPARPATRPSRSSLALSLMLHGLIGLPLLAAGSSGSASTDQPALFVELAMVSATPSAAADAGAEASEPVPPAEPTTQAAPTAQADSRPEVPLPPPEEPPPVVDSSTMAVEKQTPVVEPPPPVVERETPVVERQAAPIERETKIVERETRIDLTPPEEPPPLDTATLKVEREIQIDLAPAEEPPPLDTSTLQPADPPKPVASPKPVEPPKPVEASKPVEPAKPAPSPPPKPAPPAQAAKADTPRPAAPRPPAKPAVPTAGAPGANFGSANDARQAAAGFLPAPAIVWEGKPRFRHPPTPAVYPPRAIELNHQGEALVRVRLDAAGTAVEIVLHRSSGHHALDSAALAAVRSWHFLPAMRDGRPVPSWVEIPVRFHLR